MGKQLEFGLMNDIRLETERSRTNGDFGELIGIEKGLFVVTNVIGFGMIGAAYLEMHPEVIGCVRNYFGF